MAFNILDERRFQVGTL
jgi:hypothetical protein